MTQFNILGIVSNGIDQTCIYTKIKVERGKESFECIYRKLLYGDKRKVQLVTILSRHVSRA